MPKRAVIPVCNLCSNWCRKSAASSRDSRSEPVQSAAGFHVIKLTEQQPARVATLDELRERLTQALRAQRQEQIAKAYLEGMLNTATLSIDGAVLNKVLEEKQ